MSYKFQSGRGAQVQVQHKDPTTQSERDDMGLVRRTSILSRGNTYSTFSRIIFASSARGVNNMKFCTSSRKTVPYFLSEEAMNFRLQLMNVAHHSSTPNYYPKNISKSYGSSIKLQSESLMCLAKDTGSKQNSKVLLEWSHDQGGSQTQIHKIVFAN